MCVSDSSKAKDTELVVVGSVGLDTIQTPSERREELLGGSVSYACAAASFFAGVGMVGVVGDDFPREYSKLYGKFGIDLEGLKAVKGKTFRWSGVYDANMNDRRTISTELNVFASFSPDLPESYKDVPFLLLGNISPELQLHVFQQVRNPAFAVADTMDLWINTARDQLMEVISRVNMLTLNDSEARLLTAGRDLRACADAILAWGPEYVVIKKGEHGALLVSRHGLFSVPAYPVDVVRDPTGAGDCFAGGFMGSLAATAAVSEDQMRRSLLCGSVIASFGVEAFSLERLKQLTRQDIKKRLRELERITIA